jgi:PAS domain S-box-containing protein
MARTLCQEQQLDQLIRLRKEIERCQKIINKKEWEIKPLREKQTLFEELFRRTRDGIAIIQDWRLREVNPSLARMLKSTQNNLIGCRYDEFLAPDVLTTVKELYSRRLRGEDVTSVLETTLVDKTGETIPVEVNAGFTTYEGEKADLVIVRNLTYIKKAEAEIVRLKQYEETFLENVNIWLEVYDDERNIVIWNNAAEQISGYVREEIIGTRKNLDFLYSDKAKRQEIARTLFHRDDKKKHTVANYETEIACKDGQRKIISWYAKRIYDRNKKVIGTIVLGFDITARVKAESALRKVYKIVETLLNGITESIYMVDMKGIIIGTNSITAIRWHKKESNLIGRNVFEVLPKSLVKSYKAQFHKVIQSGQPVRFEDSNMGRYYDTTIYPLGGSDNSVEQLAVFSLDVTDRKKAEVALSQQNILLVDKNVALREMIRQIGDERDLIEKRIGENVDRLLLPLIANLRAKGSEVDKVYVDLLERNLKELSSSLGRELSAAELGFTPREIEIANMIKNGLTSKQIAKLLNISPRTVEIHRGKIRKKLGLRFRKQNLQTVLNKIKSTPP